MLLTSFAFAALPANLTLTATPDTTTLGQKFIVKLKIAPSGGPIDPFASYDNATLTAPGGLTNLNNSFADLSSYFDSDTYEWNINSTAAASYTINITVEEPGSMYNGEVNVTINNPIGDPAITIDVPDITDYKLVGQIFPINITFTNNGDGNASSINGILAIDKATISPNAISISNLENGTSTLVSYNITPTAGGNASLIANISNYRKADSTLVSAGDADFNSTGDLDWFYINFNPNLDLSSLTSINVVQGSYNDSTDLWNYVSDADTPKSNLNWDFSSDNANVNASMDAINHLLNVTAGDWTGTAVLSVYVNDSYYQDSDTVNIVVSPNCTESWSCTSWSTCSSSGIQTRTCTDSNSCGTELGKPAESQGCTYVPPSTGGGGGGSSSATTASRSFSWGSLSAGTTAVLDISDSRLSISQIEMKILSDLNNVEVKIEERKTLPQSMSPPQGAVYQYLYFSKKNIEDSDIEEAVIDFSVSKKWLSDNQVDKLDIVLMRYKNDVWNELPTDLVHSNTVDVHFSAVSPGFSYFAIGRKSEISGELKELAEDVEEKEVAEEVSGEEVQEEEQPVEGEEVAEEEPVQPEEEGKTPWVMPNWLKYLTYALIGIAIVGLIIGLDMKFGFISKRKKKAKKNNFKKKLAEKDKNFFRKGWDKAVDFFMEESDEIIPLSKRKKKAKKKKK